MMQDADHLNLFLSVTWGPDTSLLSSTADAPTWCGTYIKRCNPAWYHTRPRGREEESLLLLLQLLLIVLGIDEANFDTIMTTANAHTSRAILGKGG